MLSDNPILEEWVESYGLLFVDGYFVVRTEEYHRQKRRNTSDKKGEDKSSYMCPEYKGTAFYNIQICAGRSFLLCNDETEKEFLRLLRDEDTTLCQSLTFMIDKKGWTISGLL